MEKRLHSCACEFLGTAPRMQPPGRRAGEKKCNSGSEDAAAAAAAAVAAAAAAAAILAPGLPEHVHTQG